MRLGNAGTNCLVGKIFKNIHMIFTETELKGVWIIDIEKHEDERGFFARSWCVNEMAERGIHMNIQQANVSLNKNRTKVFNNCLFEN